MIIMLRIEREKTHSVENWTIEWNSMMLKCPIVKDDNVYNNQEGKIWMNCRSITSKYISQNRRKWLNHVEIDKVKYSFDFSVYTRTNAFFMQIRSDQFITKKFRLVRSILRGYRFELIRTTLMSNVFASNRTLSLRLFSVYVNVFFFI